MLALAMDNLSTDIEEGWQMVFRPFATASGKGIETDEAAFKLMGAFTNGDAIPTEFPFSAALAAGAELLDGACDEKTSMMAFERSGGFD